MRKSFFLLVILLACTQSKKPASGSEVVAGDEEFRHSVLVRGLNYPWELVWGPDNFIWMAERDGRISRVNPANGQVIPLITINEVVSNGEGGLLGMALHPDFAHHPEVFVSYDYNKGDDYREKIVRFTYNGNTLVNPKILLDDIHAAQIHDGCRLLITPDLKLFITTGDASDQSNPQNVNSLNGKILRINLDGSIPADNPIRGNPLWTLGNRNAQGLVFANGIMYSSEHGPANDDELNIIEKGRNYGWPKVEGFCDRADEKVFCYKNNVMEPLDAWTPTAAVCGLDYYNKDLIPEWKNSLLMVALKNSRLYRLKLDETKRRIVATKEYLTNVYGRMRDVCVAPDGKIYICTSNGSKKDVIIKIERQ